MEEYNLKAPHKFTIATFKYILINKNVVIVERSFTSHNVCGD